MRQMRLFDYKRSAVSKSIIYRALKLLRSLISSPPFPAERVIAESCFAGSCYLLLDTEIVIHFN